MGLTRTAIRALTFGLTLAVTTPAAAVWLDLDPDDGATGPRVTVLDGDEHGIRIHVRFAGLDAEAVDTELGPFTHLTMPGCGVTTEVGAPLLPVLRQAVRLPHGATPTLEIVDVVSVDVALPDCGLPADPYPAQAPVPKVPGAFEARQLAWDESITCDWPGADAALGDIGQLRAHRFVQFEVFPVHVEGDQLRVLTEIEALVTWTDADWPATLAALERYASPDMDTLASRHLLDTLDLRTRLDLPIGYLIVTYDDFYEEVAELADLRRRQGYDVTVVRTSEIPGGSNTQSIKAYVQDQYVSGEVPPTFLLLVGDTQHVPAWNGNHCWSATDVYYGTMDGGNDVQPDLHIGRLPASSAQEAERMAAKTVDYTMFQLGSGSDWIKQTTFMASVDYHWVSETTHDYCIATWLEPDGYDCERRYYHSNNASTQQVIGDINAGLSQLTYSGHGYTSGWSDGPPIDASQIPGLSNAGRLPVVQSYACYTGDYASGECFGETWLRASNGAVAFWGSSTTSYWDEDDVMQRDVYDAWYGSGYHWFRGALDQGLWGVHQAYGGGGMARAYYEQFNLMGDPALDVWTSAPTQLAADHPASVPPGTATVELVITDAGGSPVKDALVCGIVEGHLHRAAYTDGDGVVQLDLDGHEPPGTVVELMASAHDHIPWEGSLTVDVGGSGDDDDAADDDDDGGNGHQPPSPPGTEVTGAGCSCGQARGQAPGGAVLLALLGTVLARRRTSTQ